MEEKRAMGCWFLGRERRWVSLFRVAVKERDGREICWLLGCKERTKEKEKVIDLLVTFAVKVMGC